MRNRLCIFAIAAATLLAAAAYAQTAKHFPNLEPKTPRDMRLPTITYELVLPGDTQAQHVLSVDSAGNAAFRARPTSSDRPAQIAAGEMRILKFTVAQPTCTRLFELAKEANYLGGISIVPPLDMTFARTSTKFITLSYSYGPLKSFNAGAKTVRNSVTFINPPNTAIQELTSILEKIADSVERGQIAEGGSVSE